jgi:hypothetical protein
MATDTREAADPPIRPAGGAAVRWWWLWTVLAVATGAITISAANGFNIVDLELA